MEILNVLVAAFAAFAAGAVWYGALAEPWKEASNVPLGADGKPANASNPMTYVTAIICTIVVAGMMRHVFSLAGLDTLGEGVVAGLGIGQTGICPTLPGWHWVVSDHAVDGHPLRVFRETDEASCDRWRLRHARLCDHRLRAGAVLKRETGSGHHNRNPDSPHVAQTTTRIGSFGSGLLTEQHLPT